METSFFSWLVIKAELIEIPVDWLRGAPRKVAALGAIVGQFGHLAFVRVCRVRVGFAFSRRRVAFLVAWYFRLQGALLG